MSDARKTKAPGGPSYGWIATRASMLSLVAAALAAPGLEAQTTLPGPLVSTEWLAGNIDASDVVVVQIESQEEGFTSHHIPGSRFLPTSAIAWDGDPVVRVELRSVGELEDALGAIGITNRTNVVITGSRTTTTARLWMTLDYLGHGDRAALLDGGLQAWEESGRPLVDGPSADVMPTTFTATVREGMQVDAEWILARLEDPTVTLIDARPDDEYTGADGGMGGMASPGHIPGAYQLYWEELTVEGNPAKFRDPTELRSIFEVSGISPDGVGVSYCMVGLRASVDYMIGRMLGYDMKFYDGSWHDWGTRKDLPYVGGTERGGGR